MKIRLTILISLLTIILASCVAGSAVSAVEGTPTSVLASYLSTEFEDAASLRNQLALGILNLEDSPNAISEAQSGQLLILWQAYIALLESDTSVPEEINAVQDQIVELLEDEQLQAIAAMNLTNADLTAFYEQQGVRMPTPEPGMTPVSGGAGKSDLSQEEREATRATSEALGTPVGSSSGSGQDRQNILFESVVLLLNARLGK